MYSGPNAIYCNRCGSKSTSDALFCQSCGESLRATVAVPVAPFEPQLSHVTASATACTLTARYAGFWIRAVASLLDLVAVFVGFLPVRMLGFALVLAWLYRAGMESSHFQGTLGKLAVQIKVTGLDGNRISFERATGRHFAKFLSAIALGIGYLMVGFTPRKQGLHDRIAGTLVQYR
jgi:uncharacterized RDD family membrane protein YckC